LAASPPSHDRSRTVDVGVVVEGGGTHWRKNMLLEPVTVPPRAPQAAGETHTLSISSRAWPSLHAVHASGVGRSGYAHE
jgi:hypothetical protein